MNYVICRGDHLAHHGIKGQKWGERRFQNEDGSLTSEGRDHYGLTGSRMNRYQNADGSLTNDGRARMARSQRYVDSHNKTAGQRVRRTLGAGLLGGIVPGAAGAAGLLGVLGANGVALGSAGASTIGGIAAAGALSALPLMAAGALGGLAIAGLKHGVQAARVKRGQNFIDKFSSGTNRG